MSSNYAKLGKQNVDSYGPSIKDRKYRLEIQCVILGIICITTQATTLEILRSGRLGYSVPSPSPIQMMHTYLLVT